MKLSVVIPAYNEASAIGEVIGQARALHLPGIQKQIIVVDDGSSDQTGEIARSEGAAVLRHIVNRGVGAALGTGIKAALQSGADLIVTCDADGQHSPADIARVVDPILKTRADLVIGNRMSDPEGMPIIRRVANHVANLIISVLFLVRVSDSQSGLRAFSRTAAERIRIRANGFEALSEIIVQARRHHLVIAEVPIRAIYTRYSLSKGQGLRDGLKTLIRLLICTRSGLR